MVSHYNEPQISFFLNDLIYVYVTTVSIYINDATQSSLFIILQVHCTSFGCQQHPSSGAHKTVITASNAVNLATLEGDSCTKNMTSTGGCSYSSVYS